MRSPSLSAAFSSGRFRLCDCHIENDDSKSPLRSMRCTTSVVKRAGLKKSVRSVSSLKGLFSFFYFTQGFRPGLILFRPCGA